MNDQILECNNGTVTFKLHEAHNSNTLINEEHIHLYNIIPDDPEDTFVNSFLIYSKGFFRIGFNSSESKYKLNLVTYNIIKEMLFPINKKLALLNINHEDQLIKCLSNIIVKRIII